MKRFFCTTCQRIKRVRTLPDNVKTVYDEDTGRHVVAGVVEDRVGTCRWHGEADRPLSARSTHRQVNHRGNVGAHLGSTRKVDAVRSK